MINRNYLHLFLNTLIFFLRKVFFFPEKNTTFFFLWSNPQLLFFIYFCHVISSLQRESGMMYKIHKVHIKGMLAYISYVDILWCWAVLVYELKSASTCYLVKEEDLVDKYHPLVILRVVVNLINPQILPVSTNHKILLPVQKSYFCCQKWALSPDCKLLILAQERERTGFFSWIQTKREGDWMSRSAPSHVWFRSHRSPINKYYHSRGVSKERLPRLCVKEASHLLNLH